jgi:hypothetical protein
VKRLRLALLALAASLGLAACDYRNETATHVSPPQASLPDDTVLRSPSTASAAGPVTDQPGAPADATPAPAQPTANAAPDMNAQAPGANAPAPDTGAMGAQPAAGAPADLASDGTAAPTALGRFLDTAGNQKAS